MIIAGAAGISFDFADKMGKRKKFYEGLLDVLNEIFLQTKYGHLDIIECFAKLSEKPPGFFSGFFAKMCRDMRSMDKRPLKKIWENNTYLFINELRRYGCSEADIKDFIDLSDILGEYDTNSQINKISYCMKTAGIKKDLLADGLAKKQKTVLLLGICAGVFIVIVLI